MCAPLISLLIHYVIHKYVGNETSFDKSTHVNLQESKTSQWQNVWTVLTNEVLQNQTIL